MATYDIRIIGDPVLRQRADEVANIDGTMTHIVTRMIETMYEANGIGLAAPQVGVQKRLFVWDVGDGLRTIVNPEIVESDGEWSYNEGCLSVPGLFWEIIRPKQVHVVGRDLNGNEISIEADELEARLFQHELDHLDGTLLIEHLDDATRKAALKTLRELGIGPGMRSASAAAARSGPSASFPSSQESPRAESSSGSGIGGLRLP